MFVKLFDLFLTGIGGWLCFFVFFFIDRESHLKKFKMSTKAMLSNNFEVNNCIIDIIEIELI